MRVRQPRVPSAALSLVALALAAGFLVVTAGPAAGTTAEEPSLTTTQQDEVGLLQAETPPENGSATNASAQDGEDGGGGILSTITGILGSVVSFVVYSRIAHAILGLPLGILLGLKVIAIYLERYEQAEE